MATNDFFTDLDWSDCHQVKARCGCGTDNPGRIYDVFEPCKLGWDFNSKTCDCDPPGCYAYVSTIYYQGIPGCNYEGESFCLEKVIYWWHGKLISSNTPSFGGFVYWKPSCSFLHARGVLWTDMCIYQKCDGTEYPGGLCGNNSHAYDMGSVNAFAAKLSVRNYAYNEQTGLYETTNTIGLASYIQTGEFEIQPGSSRPKPLWEQRPPEEFPACPATGF